MASAGITDFKKIGYGGHVREGRTTPYFFKLYTWTPTLH